MYTVIPEFFPVRIILKVALITFFLSTNNVAFSQKVFESDSVKRKGEDSLSSKDIHPQDLPENKGFFIRSKSGKSSLRIFGSVRLFSSFDINGLSGGTGFSISNIPVGSDNRNEQTFYMTANISRVGLEMNQQSSPIGDVLVKVESDFNGNGKNFRIRHAYGQTKSFIIGQTWTGFSDIESLPNTVDIDGPPTAVSLRTVQVKYYLDFKKNWRFRTSIESPGTTVEIPDTISVEPVSQNYPAVTANLKKDWKIFTIKLAGVINPVSVRNLNGERSSLFGAGGLLSSKLKLGKHTIIFQGLFGRGIASFLNLSSNEAFDVIFNPINSEYELTSCLGGFIAYDYTLVKKRISIDVVYGMVKFKMKDSYANNTFELGLYGAANAFFNFSENLRIGAEYTYGYKKTKDGQSGNANRVALTFYYDF